jgi:hypothetical protein
MSQERCYTTAEVRRLLKIGRRSFFELKRRGQLPMLEELRPRLGRIVRYRADLVDRYLENQLFRPRAFGGARR